MIKGKNLFWSLGFIYFILSQAVWAVLPGTVITDEKNFWGHNGKLADSESKSTYIVCDGYIGSPLIPNSHDAINSFANNCESSPPPGSLPIIDIAENHSPNYQGYPAYTVRSMNSERVYFLCDGFLNSTAWCSFEAHKKAQKLLRASESKYWEPGESPLIIDDVPVASFTHKQKITSSQIQQMPSLSEEEIHKLNIPAGARVMPIDPQTIDTNSLPEGAYIKAIPMQSEKRVLSSGQEFYKPYRPDNNQISLSPELKYFLVQAIESAVDKALDRRGL